MPDWSNSHRGGHSGLKSAPNIQMQKTGAGAACQGDAALPASDLGRSADIPKSERQLSILD